MNKRLFVTPTIAVICIALTLVLASVALAEPESLYVTTTNVQTYGPFVYTNGETIGVGSSDGFAYGEGANTNGADTTDAPDTASATNPPLYIKAFVDASNGDARAYSKLVPQDYTNAVTWFRKYAEQGNADAQNWLGFCYYAGQGVQKDYVEAFKWYQKSAEQGNADAQYCLGACYDLGIGVTQDQKEGVKWYRKAAEQGTPGTQSLLRQLLSMPDNTATNVTNLTTNSPTKAVSDVEALMEAASNGDAKAQSELGKSHSNGTDVAADSQEAIKRYRKAAEQGDAHAQAVPETLASLPTNPSQESARSPSLQPTNTTIYRTAISPTNAATVSGEATNSTVNASAKEHDDFRIVLRFKNSPLNLVAEQYGKLIGKQVTVDKGISTTLSLKPSKPVKKPEAIALIEKTLIDAGLVVTMIDTNTVQISRKAKSEITNTPAIDLSFLQSTNKLTNAVHRAHLQLHERDFASLPTNNVTNATVNSPLHDIKALLERASNDDAKAQCELGDCCYFGRSVARDYARAVRWYRKAAEQGNAEAQQRLGFCYYYGDGVAKDYEEAANWYLKAASQGDAAAKDMLRTMLPSKNTTRQ